MNNFYRKLLSLTKEELAELFVADESELELYDKEEQEWIDFVKSKLSPKQRAFIEYFAEVACNEDDDPDYMVDKYLVFLGAVDLFERKPEFCPDASLDFLKHTVRHKKFEDDYAEIIEIMTIWSDNVRASKKPATRRAARISRLPKVILYPAFVFVLSFTFIKCIHIYEHFAYGVEIAWPKQIIVILISVYATRVLGKAVLFNSLQKYLNI